MEYWRNLRLNKNIRKTSWEADETFLTKRADLGITWVVDLIDLSSGEKLFMRTLQGMVNRDVARLYLINTGYKYFGVAEKFWIEEYERWGWVNIAGYLTPDEALVKFKSEIDGYIVASEKEDWTIHAATVMGVLKNAVVAPDEVAVKLKKLGWTELDNL